MIDVRLVWDGNGTDWWSTPSWQHVNAVTHKFQPWTEIKKDGLAYNMRFLTHSEGDRSILHINFKWSSSLVDWKTNFSFFAEQIKKYRQAYQNSEKPWFGHCGFLDGFATFRPILRQVVQENINTIKMIIFTGFSQGGDYAILGHEDMKFLKEQMGYTFEVKTVAYAPAQLVHEKNMENVYDRIKDVIIVKDWADIVPCLPFEEMGFTTIGQVQMIGCRALRFLPTPIPHSGPEYGFTMRKDKRYNSQL